MVSSKPAERGEEIGPDQGGPSRGDEDVAHGVVLFLVELTRLDQAAPDHAHLVRGGPDREQPVRLVPLHVLGAGDPGVGAEGLLDQEPHGVGGERHVVVAEQVVGRPLDQLEDLVGGPAEAHPLVEALDVRAGQRLGDEAGRVAEARGVDDQDRQVRVVLRGAEKPAPAQTTGLDRR